MTNKLKPDGGGQPEIEGAQDTRIHDRHRRNRWAAGEEAYPGGGVNGPLKQDRRSFETHYGEADYTLGAQGDELQHGPDQPRENQTVHGGQQGVLDRADGQAPDEARGTEDDRRSDKPSRGDRREGRAGSKGRMPGAGADNGPPEGK